MNRIIPLLFGSVALRRQFDDQGIFVELLVQTWFEFIQNGHRGANNLTSEFFVFHKERVNHGFHGFHGCSVRLRRSFCMVRAIDAKRAKTAQSTENAREA
jgi:hypothetical protein